MTTPNNFDAEKQIEHFRLLTPTSRFVDLITGHRPRASVLNARLVYSWLAYRSRLDLQVSLRSIHRDVGLHSNTIKLALADLGSLVRREANDWHAIEPPPGMFHERSGKHGEHWSDLFAYSLVFLPKKGAHIVYPKTKVRFGLNHAIVWSHIVRSRNGNAVIPRFTIGGTAALYGLADNTVRSVLNDLVWLKLVTRIDKGGFSELRVHVPSSEVLSLFRLKEGNSSGKQRVAAERKPLPYTLRNDGWDNCRQLCHGLMPQKLADEIVAMAKQLDEVPNDFRSEFVRLRQQYEANKKAEGKFGAYLRTAYANRLSEFRTIESQQAEEERIANLMANTDFIALREKRAEAVAHDPLHKEFSWSVLAVVARVDLGVAPNRCEIVLDKITGALHTHIRNHISKHHQNLNTQQAADRITTDKYSVLKSALARLNDYYLQPTKATVDQFKEQIDNALSKIGVEKLFDPKKEPANV